MAFYKITIIFILSYNVKCFILRLCIVAEAKTAFFLTVPEYNLFFFIALNKTALLDFPGGTVDKSPPANVGDGVQSLVREDFTNCGATKPVRHNY